MYLFIYRHYFLFIYYLFILFGGGGGRGGGVGWRVRERNKVGRGYPVAITEYMLQLKTLFNIVEERLQQLLNLDVCVIMMFRKVNKQPGMQQFWNWCSHYQGIYDWIAPLNKRAGSAINLTQ